MPTRPGPLLSKIDRPEDLKKLEPVELIQLSAELRQYIIDEVSCNPGHLGASLGVVELTVALHYVFNTPYDKLIWDVGHQAYGHKILTGRRDLFHTNRKKDGLSGYPHPAESEYDSFVVGHSSTSISAAIGMAVADQVNKINDRKIVAIIGDGSMTAGLAFEGLNNAGVLKSDILVILNDNQMAIDKNTGAFSEYLLDISTSRTYNKVKNEVWRVLGKVSKWGPNAQQIIQKIDNGIKSIVLRHSNLFESLNFRYFGPVDGHDVIYLAKLMQDLRNIPGPKVLHVLTKKGKGFIQAEQHQTVYHAPGLFNKETGELVKEDNSKPLPDLYQDVFGKTLLELAEQNPKIVAITPAMPTGCSLNFMMEKIPERVFDVGIAEQHAVTFSAGLAKQGVIPFCNIYSSFMQRAYDQVIHDVALQSLPVVFCLDRAGLVGSDGVTHQGAYDIAYLRCIPGMTIAAPMNETELRNIMFSAQFATGPYAIRYPRGRGVQQDWKKAFEKIEPGKGRKLREGEHAAILTIGHPGNFASQAIEKVKGEGLSIAHYDMRFVKPLDEVLLHEVFRRYKVVITVEDGTIVGGFGSAILEFMNANSYQSKVVMLGIPDKFIEHATQPQQYEMCGFDTQAIISCIRTICAVDNPVKEYNKA